MFGSNRLVVRHDRLGDRRAQRGMALYPMPHRYDRYIVGQGDEAGNDRLPLAVYNNDRHVLIRSSSEATAA